jgi:hypothetical protein
MTVVRHDAIRTFRELSTIARNCGAEALTPLDAAGAKAAVKCWRRQWLLSTNTQRHFAESASVFRGRSAARRASNFGRALWDDEANRFALASG